MPEIEATLDIMKAALAELYNKLELTISKYSRILLKEEIFLLKIDIREQYRKLKLTRLQHAYV